MLCRPYVLHPNRPDGGPFAHLPQLHLGCGAFGMPGGAPAHSGAAGGDSYRRARGLGDGQRCPSCGADSRPSAGHQSDGADRVGFSHGSHGKRAVASGA